MKFMTLNTHSLVETNYTQKKEQFINMLEKEQPDIVALQEVNQSANAGIIPDVMLAGYTRCMDFGLPVREDNHAKAVVETLREQGIYYYWTWISAKLGYGKYDEGMALLSKEPIARVRQYLISQVDDYANWKTRKMLGIQTEDCGDWFFTVHMGWWNDEEEPLQKQWEKMEKIFKDSEFTESTIWLLGDFNSLDNVKQEGYDLICNSGWKDTYKLAVTKDSGVTVEEEIDGWRSSDGRKGMKDEKRLDYIFCNQEKKIEESRVVCNGKNYPVVSDHYGVLIEVGK